MQILLGGFNARPRAKAMTPRKDAAVGWSTAFANC